MFDGSFEFHNVNPFSYGNGQLKVSLDLSKEVVNFKSHVDFEKSITVSFEADELEKIVNAINFYIKELRKKEIENLEQRISHLEFHIGVAAD